MLLLVWVFYSAQIFLLGAEFTWVYAHSHGSRRGVPVAPSPAAPSELPPHTDTALPVAGIVPSERPNERIDTLVRAAIWTRVAWLIWRQKPGPDPRAAR